MIERTLSASRAETRLLKAMNQQPRLSKSDEPTTESVEENEPTTETRGRNNSNCQQLRCEKYLKENKFGWESTQKWVEAWEFDGTEPKIIKIQRSQNRSRIRISEWWIRKSLSRNRDNKHLQPNIGVPTKNHQKMSRTTSTHPWWWNRAAKKQSNKKTANEMRPRSHQNAAAKNFNKSRQPRSKMLWYHVVK